MKISGTDLEEWAGRVHSRPLLPELVRRLIHGTIPLSDIGLIDFPSGEGVQKHGVDGRLVVTKGHAFVPDGHSVWEIGSDAEPKKKANTDYDTRSEDPGAGIDPKQTTFVFVTPRRWYNHEKWAIAKRKEGIWADVRVFDADAVEQWLDLAPAAGAWLGPHVSKPQDAEEIEAWWKEWSLQTEPPTSPELVRGGRDEATQTLHAWLGSTPRVLSAEVDDVTEAAAFLYTSIRLLGPKAAQAYLDRAVVATSAETVRRLSLYGRGLLIAARDCPIEVARLAELRGHHVLRATSTPIRGPGIKLGPMTTNFMSAALEQMGLPKDEAMTLAFESGGALSLLRRRLGDVEAFDASLSPWLLVAALDESDDDDVALVATIVGREPSQVRDDLRRWSVGPGAVFLRAQHQVRWVSHEAAWRALARHLLVSDLRRFAEVVVAVFQGAITPNNTQPIPSATLRLALVEVLTKTVAWPGLDSNVDAQGVASWVVERLMSRLETQEAWEVVAPSLQTLAEAAPVAWMRAMTHHLDTKPEVLRKVIAAAVVAFGSRALHDLVAALETLTWNPDHLSDAALILARLAELDPGGNSHPRPAGSLRAIFIPAFPQTCASLDERFSAMERLARACPTVSLRLILGFFETQSVFFCSRPVFRPWAEGWVQGVPAAERREAIVRLQGLAIRIGVRVPTLWPELVRAGGRFSEAHYAELLGRLEEAELGTLEGASQADLASAVREALSLMRRRDEDASNPDHVRRLEKILQILEPSDVRERHRWLFEPLVTLPDIDDIHEPERHIEALNARRAAAASELVAALSNDELLAFVETLVPRGVFGFAVAASRQHRTRVLEFISRTFESGKDWQREFRDGMAAALHDEDAQGFMQAVRDPGEGLFGVLTDMQRAELLAPLRGTRAIWQIVDGLTTDARLGYWRRMEPFFAAPEDVAQVVERLVECGRGRKALEIAGLRIRQAPLPPELIVRVLRASTQAEGADEPVMRGMKSHHLRLLLDGLAAAGEAWRAEGYALERVLWPEVQGDSRPRFLFDELERHPETFVDLVCEMVKQDDGQREAVSETESIGASRAWRVLSDWDTLPGLSVGPSGLLIDGDALLSWIQRARDGLRARNRRHVGDRELGAMLGRAPHGSDGHWPHEAVRDVLERLNDVDEIERGILRGRINARGWVNRDPGEGGAQSRALAEQCETSAAELRRRWPTAARCLDALARIYREQGAREDRDPVYASQPRWPTAYPQERVRVFCDELQARGQYVFSFHELMAESGTRDLEARDGTQQLMRDHRLVSPEGNLFVIVPLEYRSVEAPPTDWYLDSWMAFAEVPYAVGLLSAAAYHGAFEQAVQVAQVLVTQALKPRIVGRARFDFVVDAKAGDDFGVVRVKTATGSMRVTTAERTLWDLIEHADAVGSIDLAARVIEELVRKNVKAGKLVSGRMLAEHAEHYPVDVAQRLGWILERLGHRAIARGLREVVGSKKPSPVSLRPAKPFIASSGLRVRGLWQVWADSPLETDS